MKLMQAMLGVIFAAQSFAQIDTGSIVGSVRDPSGAAVPSATITLTNDATSVARSTVTNASGEYQFIAVPPGVYSIKVTAKGFAAQGEKNIEIHVQARPSIDFTLKVGEVAEVLQVEAQTPLLSTQSADVGGVVQEKQIRDLPLNGRRYADLALLEAGIQKNLTNPNNQAPDRFSSNGNLETQNYFSLDGIDNNSGSTNLQEGSVQTVQPPPDALQEFRVQTRTYSSEFGTSAGAVINASIKSGSNQFHGDVWEFLRNNKLDANSFFNNAGGVPRGHYSQNQYGGTIGGPIIKNRTFFFFDMQDFTARKATTIQSTVPTPLMKTGNFTELKPVLTDPKVAGQSNCISGNIIASACIDPVATRLAALYPAPNLPSAVARLGQPGSWTGATNYLFQYSVPTDITSLDTRIDHNFTPNSRVFGRYSNFRVDRQDPPWTGNPIAGNGNFATQYLIRGQSIALAWTDLVRPSMLNELRAGFSRDNAHSTMVGLESGKSLAADFGLTGIPPGPYNAGIPPVNVTGLTRLGSSPFRPQFQVSQTWQLLDTLSWLKGDHSFKFGYEHRHTSDNFLDLTAPQGQISASGIYSGNVGLGFADFLLGDISTGQYTTPTVVHNYQYSSNFFAQDTWRIRHNLTINYGLRYELFSPILNHQNAMSNFTPANGGGFVTAKDGDWFSRALVHPDKNDFAPRFGFSWQPLQRMVLRGGYGIFYQHVARIGSESMLALNPPAVIDASLIQTVGSITPVFQLRNGFPVFSPSFLDLTRLQFRAQDPNERTGYVSQVSFGPQFQLTQSTALEVSYVGNFGRKMNRLRNANQGFVTGFDSAGKPLTVFPYANLNTTLTATTGNHAFLEFATDDGNTNYNGLLVSLRRRFSKGLALGINYTLSHNFSDYVDNLTGGSTPASAYNYSLERSNSPFDVRHRFVAHGTYQLPIGQGGLLLNNNNLASRLIGGWQLNTIMTLETGTPFTVTAPDNSATGGSHQSRASCISDPYLGATADRSKFVGGSSPGFFLNSAAFANPAAGFFGNCAPRAFHGPGIENVDFSIFKNFAISERWRVEFRTEFFNAFNRANFNNPSASIAAAALGSFGKSLSTIADPREIQFALKLYF
jgi:hypothetical protein